MSRPPESNPSALDGHGQFGEDTQLLAIFGAQPTGACLEVGAFDGITGSATYAFEIRGWQTILIEPQPPLAAKIALSRRGRLFAVAAGDHNGYAWLDPHEDPAQTKAQPVDESKDDLAGRQRIPLRTIDSILEESGVATVDFATIDVEGSELTVLRGWSLEQWKPRVLIIEDGSRGVDRTVPDYLAARGYRSFMRTGVNDWYAQVGDALLTLHACARQRWWRRWRRIRTLIRQLPPRPLIDLLRRLRLAGE